jgi:hypothetical protein
MAGSDFANFFYGAQNGSDPRFVAEFSQDLADKLQDGGKKVKTVKKTKSVKPVKKVKTVKKTTSKAVKGGKSSPKKAVKKPSYKKTAKKYTDRKGGKHTIYTKLSKGVVCEYIKKLSKTTGKFIYRKLKA